MKFGIGDGPRRVEDPVLVRGQGRYTDDVHVEGALKGHVFRSPVAHATITKLDVEAARSAPGVVAVLTGEELTQDDVKPLACLTDIRNGDGSKHPKPPRHILAKEKVRHVGEPVAFIVAETLAQARDAADLIEFDFDELPVATGTYEATLDGAPQVWEEAPNNVILDYEKGDKEEVAAIFDKAAKVSKVRIVNNRLVCNAMEPRAAVAEVKPGDGKITLYVPSQGPAMQMQQLSAMLGIDMKNLRLVTGHVGGGFGTKAFLYPEACLTLWAAKRLGRSVRWTGDRGEMFVSDSQGRDHVTFVEVAMDEQNRFQALRATTYAALGAYLANFAPFIPTDACAGMYTGLYKIPKMYLNVKGVMTNTVPTDAYRGAGRPEAAYMIERLVEQAAKDAGISSDEIRRINFPDADEMPHTMGLGDVIDSGDFTGLMEDAMKDADWAGFAERRKQSEARGRLRGIGMATYVERCGGGAGVPARISFEEKGKVRIYSGGLDSGQGHAVSYAQILSQKLGIDAEDIELIQGDTDRTPPGFTGGSKSIPVGGASVLDAAEAALEKGRKVAAKMLETAEVDIEYADGRFSVAGTDRGMSLYEVAEAAKDPANLPEGVEPGLDNEQNHNNEKPTFPNGCHICEVEVDPQTGQVELLDYTVVDDFGVTLNPILLEGQVHGGIVQGVGQAWHEHTVYDEETGQLLSGSFMDYQMPRAEDFPPIRFRTRNVRCTTNPLGVKGAGEAGAIGAPPAFVNAVRNAVDGKGNLEGLEMPLTPVKVWTALHG
ncbi:xanthine dehydrogenase family protein molybdopterin-binding subunit [Minwuia thermotolerans]|uniref:Carbon monoxide dehydrogenase n=1 Tax=Minwuia thermotolerans TaxID=2056226 RepID=A0A2M9G4B4_9PROT|nr:xanthine dehydrogenase family protein molybdopterin-binding subunit [Minwuia thermotolerans]PJK30538.1 carbon monoxide dehydrogenase [Minwuia thermotolerans]